MRYRSKRSSHNLADLAQAGLFETETFNDDSSWDNNSGPKTSLGKTYRELLLAGLKLQPAIDDSPKLDLLHGRKVPDKDGGLPCHKTLHFQHYLSVNNADHRKFITRLLLSCHLLLALFDAAPIYAPALPVGWMIT